MAISPLLVAFFFTLALAEAGLYSTQVLTGSISCRDCPKDSDLSGVQVLVKCDKVKKLGVAYTEEDGSFQTNLPSDGPQSTSSSNCMAKIMGGPYTLFVPAKDSLAQVIANDREHFTTARALSFYKSCPLEGQCGGTDKGFASSKTVDLPLPREWGLAPSSYYVPFIPIIGIP